MRRFAHRQALAVGEPDVAALLERLPARELMQWVAYAELEPWGEERADVRAGIIAATVYSLLRPRGARAMTVRDFMAVPPRTGAGLQDKIKTFTAMLRASAKGSPRE